MKISIVIPAYNEEDTIEEILEEVATVALPYDLEREIIVVNDASTDRTAHLLKKSSVPFVLITHEKNKGKGQSVIDGLKAATGDIVVIQDADLEYTPRDFNKMIPLIVEGDADVVYGSRFVTTEARRVLYFWHHAANKFLTTLSNVFTNLNLTDMEVCYKMFTKRVVDDIKDKLVSRRFGIEPELTARIKHYRVYEVGISYRGRTYGEGKKIGWKDGVAAIWSIIRFNLFS